MLHIVICDDLEPDRAAARQGVEAYLAAHQPLEAQIDVFSSPAALMDALEDGASWDVALLDVYMPGVLGTQVAQRLSERLKELVFLFLTTSQDHAVEAFALGAAHYLVKPFTQEQLNTALDRAVAPYRRREDKSLLLHLESGVTRSVPLEDITHIESVGRRRVVHTAKASFDERQQTLSVLLDRLETLAPGQFITPCRGYIVNLNAIRTITAQDVQLYNGVDLPIRRGDFRRIRSAYFQWAFRKEEEE